MSNVSGRLYASRAVQQVPPVHGVKDRDTRQALEVLIAGWRVRNGETASDDRFVTLAELNTLRREMLQAGSPENRNMRSSTGTAVGSGGGGGGGGVVVGGGGGGGTAVNLLPLNNSWTGTNSFSAAATFSTASFVTASFSQGIDVDFTSNSTITPVDAKGVTVDTLLMPTAQTDRLIGLDASIVNTNADVWAVRKAGVQVVFKDRTGAALNPTTLTAATYPALAATLTWPGTMLPNGFVNKLNWDSAGLVIDSQDRSAAGEFCGWQRGIYFAPTALDMNPLHFRHSTLAGVTASPYAFSNKAIGIDMTAVAGWPTPDRLGRLASAIALPPDLGISFDTEFKSQLMGTFDPFGAANVIGFYQTYLNPNESVLPDYRQRFAVNMDNGDLYLQAADTGTRRPRVYVNKRLAALFDTELGNNAMALWSASSAGLTLRNTNLFDQLSPQLVLKTDVSALTFPERGSLVSFRARDMTGADVDHTVIAGLMTSAVVPKTSLLRFTMYGGDTQRWLDFDGGQMAVVPGATDSWDLGSTTHRFKVARAAKVETDAIAVSVAAAAGPYPTAAGFLPITVGGLQRFIPLYQ